jgi:hypothetical protein
MLLVLAGTVAAAATSRAREGNEESSYDKMKKWAQPIYV